MNKFLAAFFTIALAAKTYAGDRTLSLTVATDNTELLAELLENFNDTNRSGSLYGALFNFFKQAHQAFAAGVNVVTTLTSSSPVAATMDVAINGIEDAVDGKIDGVINGQDVTAQDAATSNNLQLVFDISNISPDHAQALDKIIATLSALLSNKATTLAELQETVAALWELLQLQDTAVETAVESTEAASSNDVSLSEITDTALSTIATVASIFKSEELDSQDVESDNVSSEQASDVQDQDANEVVA